MGRLVNMQARSIRGNYSWNRISGCLVSRSTIRLLRQIGMRPQSYCLPVYFSFPLENPISSISPSNFNFSHRARYDSIRNFFRTTNHVSLPSIFDRSLFNLYHKLKDKFVISAVKFTRFHGYTVHDEFLFPFINRMSPCAVVRSIRVSFVPNRKMSITVPTWTESPLSPTFVPPSSGIETVRQIFPSPANEVSPGSCTRRNFATGEPGSSARMCIWRGNNSRRRCCAPLHLQFPLHRYC